MHIIRQGKDGKFQGKFQLGETNMTKDIAAQP